MKTSASRPPLPSPAPAELEQLAAWHASSLLVITTWLFGGSSAWAQPLLAGWGSLSVVLLVLGVREKRQHTGTCRRLHWLWPLVAFNLIVLTSLLNPNHREISGYGETGLIPGGEISWLPSCVQPGPAGTALWLFDALFLTAFNLAFLVRRRTTLRRILVVVGVNTLILAVFGTLQKLTGATGLFFGAVPSPNPAFFASFVYHNHWGPTALLTIAVCLGLVWHYAGRRSPDYRDPWHSPIALGLVAVFFMAAAIPLSTSRSSTLLLLILLGGALVHWALCHLRQHRPVLRTTLPLLALAGVAVTLALGAIFWLGQPVIEARLAVTQEQFAAAQARHDLLGSRGTLYRDTWHMAQDKLGFGWGMASYPAVFVRYNTQTSPIDRLPVIYYDAHNDWLQALAEHGLVGTALLALLALVPLAALRKAPDRGRALPLYLLAGCLLILLYAWVEFPFGCPAVVLLWWVVFFCAVRHQQLDAETL